MARGITLKGDAARAFVESMSGRRIGAKASKGVDADLMLAAIAVRIALEVKSGTKFGMTAAKLIVKGVADDGVEAVYRRLCP